MASNFFRTLLGFSINGQTNIIRGTADPSTTATPAPITSLYCRDLGTGASLYQKTGAADTAWTIVATTSTLEDGYQNAFIGKGSLGSLATAFSSTSVVSNGDSLQTAIGKLDGAIGASVTPVSRTYSPIVAGADRRNIEKLDAAIGLNPTSTNYITTAQSVNANLSALDTKAKSLNDTVNALQTGLAWITPMAFITAENLTSRSGLAHFTDDVSPYSLPQAGDRVVSTFDNKLYIAASGVWAAGTALTSGNTFFVTHNLINSDPNKKGEAAYNYNGSSCVLVASFDFEMADSIALNTGYVAAAGTVASGDTIQAAIAKVDGNASALDQAVGVSAGATNLGSFTGTGATRILTATESAKTALQKIANDIGLAAGGSGDYASNQAVNANINALDAQATEVNKKISVTGITSDVVTTIDTIDMSANGRMAEYDIVLMQSSNNANRYISKLRMSATANGNDYTEYAVLVIGNAFANVAVSVDSTTLGSTLIKVTATCTGGYAAKIVRRLVVVA